MSSVAERHPARVGATTSVRVDLYATIHKAMRQFMGDTLARVGRLDPSDGAEVAATLGQLEGLLEFCRAHVSHESRFVHAAIEARSAGASSRISAEHDEHLQAIAALAAEAAALGALPSAPASHRLYRHLALFVAENLRHMDVEETVHNAALWAAYSDAELLDIQQRLLASIDATGHLVVLRWMVPAMAPAERAAMLGRMQRQVPPEAMLGALEIVRPHLDRAAWGEVATALGLERGAE